MCGIVGAYDLRERRLFSRVRLRAMTGALAHRGPDGESFHLEPGLAMGVRRLALVDPVGGGQPMADEEGRVVVSVNGELYNYRSERKRLETSGERFRTDSDTEVWLRAWRREGPDFLPRARGQFALAAWDRSERRLTLARDRFGICPLFVCRTDGWLLWASEIKALLASGLLDARLDARALDHFFTFLCAGQERSAFVGVAPLRPGRYAVAGPEGLQAGVEFARVDFPDESEERRAGNKTELDILTRELAERMEAAVEKRLRPRERNAVYLSGGVDSSWIAALAAKRSPGAVSAFTVRLAGTGRDESDSAAETARALGLDLERVSLSAADINSLFPDVVTAAESPIMDHADACLLALSRTLRDRGFKSVLTGEGADEAFAGYPWFRLHALPGKTGIYLARLLTALGGAWIGGGRGRLRLDGLTGELAQAPLFSLMARARTFFYSANFWEELGSWSPWEDHPWATENHSGRSGLNHSLRAEYQLLLAGHLLMDKGDRMAMASGVEARFPYLDEDVVDFASSLAGSLKLRGFRDKFLLRRAARELLDAGVANRKKHMFRAGPVIHGRDRPDWVNQLLLPESLERTGFFDAQAVQRALAFREKNRRYSLRGGLLEAGLTSVVSTQLLHHIFCGGGLCELPAWKPFSVKDATDFHQ